MVSTIMHPRRQKPTGPTFRSCLRQRVMSPKTFQSLRCHNMKKFGVLLFVIITLGTTGVLDSQPVATPPVFSGNPTFGVLPHYNDANANWRNAGMQSVGGIPNRTTICGLVLTPLGGGMDDKPQIQTAINNCTVGQVVQLGVGRFIIGESETLNIEKGITLRGCTQVSNCATSSMTDNCNASSGTLANGTVGPGANFTGSPYCATILDSSAWGAVVSGANMAANNGCNLNGCVPNPGITLGLGYPESANNSWATPTTLAADAAQGDTKITVASVSGFSVGQWVLMNQGNGPSFQPDPSAGTGYATGGQIYASPDFLNSTGSSLVNGKQSATNRLAWQLHNPTITGDTGGMGEYCNFTQNLCNGSVDGHVVNEIHKIIAINGNTITFDEPLTIAVQTALGSRLYFPTPLAFVQNVGIENLTVHGASSGGVVFNVCVYCWAKGVEVDTWNGGGISSTYSARIEMNRDFIHHYTVPASNGAEYGFNLQTTTEAYIVDSISVLNGKGMVSKAGGSGTVVAYNYMDMIPGVPPTFVELGANGSHLAGSHHILLEGNWSHNLDNDSTHGSEFYHTFFRNLGTAIRSPFLYYFSGQSNSGFTITDSAGSNCNGNSSGCGVLRAAGVQENNYWHAFVGNVLGVSGVTLAGSAFHTNAQFSNNGANQNPGIWLLGWRDVVPQPVDPNGTTWTFRHGNYNYFNSSIQYDAGTPDHNLPNSFYLPAKPSFFTGASCAYPWPPVTPAGASQLPSPTGPGACTTSSGFPAKARFDAGTPFVQP